MVGATFPLPTSSNSEGGSPLKLSSLASYFLAGAFLTTGVYVGIIAALVLGPIFNWIIFFIYKETDSAYAYIGLGWGIVIGIAVATVIALGNGGLACLQHALLRFLLWRS